MLYKQQYEATDLGVSQFVISNINDLSLYNFLALWRAILVWTLLSLVSTIKGWFWRLKVVHYSRQWPMSLSPSKSYHVLVWVSFDEGVNLSTQRKPSKSGWNRLKLSSCTCGGGRRHDWVTTTPAWTLKKLTFQVLYISAIQFELFTWY